MTDSVVVLLAAFNGAPYIERQILTILSSKNAPEISIVVGLDPSTDKTAEVLDRMKRQEVSVVAHQTPSGSAAQNFSRLCRHAVRRPGDYFAFSDQDDEWDEERVARTFGAVRELERNHGPMTPVLAFSDSRLIDEKGATLAPSFWGAESLDPSNANDFRRLLLQNVGQGCTFLFNRALLELATPVPPVARMHDHWFLQVACALGQVGFVPGPLVSYRQHHSNVLGSKGHGPVTSILRLLAEASSMRLALERSRQQADAFASRYRKKLDTKTLQLLEGFVGLSRENWFGRRLFCLRHGICMSGPFRTAGMYLLI